MKVFISWSGDLSRVVAELLRKYLRCMIQELNPFMSKHDLGSGVRWAEALARELEDANFGIVCLTPDNLREPWILFEAGALTKHVEGRACCVLLEGLAQVDVAGPLAQFQNRRFSQDDVKKLMVDINAQLLKPLDQPSLDLAFDKWWPDLERDVLAAIKRSDTSAATTTKRTPGELLEELLLRVRSVQKTIERQEIVKGRPASLSKSTAIAIADTLEELPPSQISVLKKFAIPREPRALNARQLEKQFGKDAIDGLVREGLLVRQGSTLIAHHLIVDYLLHFPVPIELQ